MDEKSLRDYLKSLYPKENEACEWKEFKNLKHAWSSKRGEDVESYISAIANMRGGHIVIGVEDKTLNIIGISDFSDYTIENAKPRLAGRCAHLNTEKVRITEHITEDTAKIVWVIEVPQHESRLPVYAHGFPWQRVGDSLEQMRPERLEAIRREPIEEADWSAEIVEDARIADLDDEAIATARAKFTEKNSTARWAADIPLWRTDAFLDKAQITAGGKITRTALLLLGRKNSIRFLSPQPAQLTWSLEAEERAYEHFFPPFIITATHLRDKIRNIKYKLFPENQLLPAEIQKYDARSILEALHNCIAHQDYTLNERVVVVERFDRVVFENAGGFYEGTPDAYLTGNVRPRKYRNKWLADAMVEVGMIDTLGYGIFEMTKSQMGRYLPLPDYRCSTKSRTILEVLGRPIDEKYSQLLLKRSDLDIDTVILLDRVQKNLPISAEAVSRLRREKLIEGKSPNWRVASSIAAATGTSTSYTLATGVGNAQLKELIKAHLKKFPGATRPDIDHLVMRLLGSGLSEKQKKDKITNVLAAMKRDGALLVEGRGPGSKWYLRP